MFLQNEILLFRKYKFPLFPPLKKVYEDEKYIYCVYDQDIKSRYSTNLKNITIHPWHVKEIQVATFAYIILKGLKQLHQQQLYHGNLNLENIIFSSERDFFLMNFKYPDQNTEQLREYLIQRGDNQYVAPEILEQKPFDQKIDIFSLSVCIYFMIFKKTPYSTFDIERCDTELEIQQTDYKYKLDLSLLEKINDDYKKNPLIKQILSASGIDFIYQLLNTDPQLRPTSNEALKHAWFIPLQIKEHNKKDLNNYIHWNLRNIFHEDAERDSGEFNQQEVYKEESDNEDQIQNDDDSSNIDYKLSQLQQICMKPSKYSKNMNHNY